MGCCFSSPPDIDRPKVRKCPASAPVNVDELPLGILLTGGAKLRAMDLKGQHVRVAVIDSGIDKDHPGFNGKVTKQTWYRKGTPLSEDDHGTHVAGTIHLMAPEAELYDYRVFGASGDLGVDAAISEAINDAVKNNCHVINMSLGGPLPTPSIRRACQNAFNKGVILVCAAGNGGDNNPLTNEISYPAYYTECISVAAVSKKDGLPVAVFSNSNDEVDYAGIGVNVVSFQPGGGCQEMSGTSMATPHVCGFIAALMSNGRIQNKGKETDPLLRKTLTETYAMDIATQGRDNVTGLGFLTALDKDNFTSLLGKIQGDLASATVH